FNMENVYENVRRELSPENVKEALQVMLERMHLPENEAKVQGAKEQAGDDMVEVFKNVFPIVLQIQIEVVSKFGFVSNQEGLKDFLIRVNQLTNEYSEILDLMLKIREVYLPGFSGKAATGTGEQPEKRGSGGTSVASN
ncbi:Protein C10, partial [Orchesella cincta]